MRQVKQISPLRPNDSHKVKVAAYCRVSTNFADQKNSLTTQIRTYKKLIEHNPEWEMVEVFADEGISGMKAENRPEFQRMIRMCELHQIDLIYVKSLSRFARNVKEALEYTRKLKALGVGVYFEKECINTLALADEMLLNVFSGIAQEESQSISQNRRFSIVKKMQAGEYVDNNAPYGYRLENMVLTPYEPEADIVRKIFDWYLCGMSSTEIGRELTKEGIPTKRGSDHWDSKRIAYILRNEKYVGDSLYQKKYSDSTVPFKQHVNKGQEDMYYAQSTHKAIIDREKFESVQALLQARTEKYAKSDKQKSYPLTSRIQCLECGSYFHRRNFKGTIKWACSKHFRDCHACNSNYYTEERIYDGFVAMVNKLRFGEEKILTRVIDKLQEAVMCMKKQNQAALEISQNMAELNTKLMMLDQLYSKNYLAVEVYQAQSHALKDELAALKAMRQDKLESRLIGMLDQVKELQKYLSVIQSPLETFHAELFEQIVVKITINNRNEMVMTVLGGLKFKEII